MAAPNSPQAPATRGSGAKKAVVYVGTYTGGESKGIYRLTLDLTTGRLTPAGVTTGVTNPSFLALHPSGRYLYAVNEMGEYNGRKTGLVSAYSIDRTTGSLTHLNDQPSEGGGPAYVAVDHRGRCVLVANYGGGSVAVLPIGAGGRLGQPSSSIQHHGSGVDPERQEAPHAHSINVSPDNRFAFAADLGLDQVLIYRLDAEKGTLSPNDPQFASVKPGSGPRHLAFHPKGRTAYVLNEMAATVTVFDYDARTGGMKARQTLSTLPSGYKGRRSGAEVAVSPDGRFVYCSNRGHDSIAIFRVDGKTGQLTALGYQPTLGQEPRNFCIDPTGSFLLAANQKSNSVVVFRIDQRTGRLTPSGFQAEVPIPVCVRVLPPGD